MISKILDSVIALRIIYLLSTPIERTEAFKLGLIDANGGQLKKAETPDEKNATSMLHRLVWNIKKVFNLVPGGKTRLGSLAAAYLLVKESYNFKHSEQEALVHFNENFDRVWGLPFEEREIVIDAFEALTEDAAANATGSAVSTDVPKVMKAKVARRFGQFEVDEETFNKFKTGEFKSRKWTNYLNMEDATHKMIYDFAKKNPNGVMILKDAKGSMKGVRFSKRGSDHWANLNKIQESVGYEYYDQLTVEDIQL